MNATITTARRAAAHQQNLDAAQREMDQRQAEGEDMTGATIDQHTYAITRHPDVVAAEAEWAAIHASVAFPALTPAERARLATIKLTDTPAADVGFGDKLEEDAASGSDGWAEAEAKINAAEAAGTDWTGATTEQFTIKPLDVEYTGQHGSGRATAKVNGYWSGDSITLYVERKVDWSNFNADDRHPAEWVFTMSHSSGGRDTAEETDDLQASANFAAAIYGLCQYAAGLKAAWCVAAGPPPVSSA
jgi:hypothetical protein